MRNIIFFIVGVTVIAWGGGLLAHTLDPTDPAMSSVGLSIAAMGPLFMAIVLRKWSGKGWRNAGLKMRLKQNKRWYAFSLLYAPLVIALIAALSLIFGTAQPNPDSADAVNSMFTTAGIVLVPMLFLSVGEEFGWRGYLEPGLWSIHERVVLNHVVVGIIWGFWHFPILLFTPSNDTNPVQLLMVLLGCVALAIIYGQMRLWSNSVWPCVILHAVSNTFMISFAGSELLLFSDGVKDILSFNTTSVAVTGIWVMTSLLILALLGKKSAAQLVRTGGYQR